MEQSVSSLTVSRGERLAAHWTELAGRLVVFLTLGCLSLLVWVAAAILWSATANAAPAAPQEFELTQPGGKTFTAKLFGDEWNNGLETREGFTIVHNRETGEWEYAVKGPQGGLEPSGKAVGGESPPPVGKHLRSEAPSDLPPQDAESTLPQAPELQEPQLAIPNTGTQKSLVILVRFPDQTSMGSTPAQWNTKFFGATNSVQHYYKEVSYGKLTIGPATESHGTTNDGVVGWLTMNYNHPNTANTTNDGTPNRLLTRDAVRAADPYVNYAAYDSNGDGFLSSQELHVTVIVAGQEGSCCKTFGKAVWGHRWSLFGTERPIVDSVVFGDPGHGGGYTQFGEWHGDHMATIGIMVHEMGHDLYLPDLYDTFPAPPDTDSEGVGAWSVMGGGSWSALPENLAGTSPSHFDAWSKWYEGWLTPRRASGTQAIGQAETNATAIQLRDNPNGVDWTFDTNSGTGEYFLIENRQRVGYDAALPGCGLLVWHIDETRRYDNYANYDQTRRLVDLEEADGLNHLDSVGNRGDGGDPYPGSSNNSSFNGTSNPNSKLYDGTSSGVAGENMSGPCSSSMSATLTDPGVVQRPANDDQVNAQSLTGSSATATGTNVNASKEAGEPNHAGNAGGKSVWYKWTPQASGTTTINTTGSNFDTLLGVYTIHPVHQILTEVASNDDENNAGGVITSKLSFVATAGTTYWIAVDGYNLNGAGAEAGNITLNLSSVSQGPANNNFANAQALSGSSATVTGTNVNASKEAGEPNHAGNAGGKSVWYKWTPQASGTTTINTAGSNFDTLLAVYRGSAVNSLTQVASNDDENNAGGVITSKLSFVATAGTTYWIAVDGYNLNGAGAEAGNITLRLASTDTTAPKVMSTSPANNATGIASSADVTATFTEAMDASTSDGDPSTITSTTFKLVRFNADGTTTRVTAAVSYDAVAKKAILNPSSNLSSGRTYKATVTSGAQDLAGNALDQNPTTAGNQSKSWKFKVL